MLDWIWQVKVGAQEAALIALILLAFLRGAAPERGVAITFTMMIAADRLYHWFLPSGLFSIGIDLGHCGIDFSAFISILVIALRANRIYPLCLAALQLAATISHVVMGLNPSLLRSAYAILMIAPSYLQILVLGLGILLHWRRTVRRGRYPSWLRSSPHSQGAVPPQ